MTDSVRWLTVAGIRMRVLDEGQGPAVLALHGFTGCAETMQVVVQGAGAGRRIIRPDLVGHGETDAPDDVAAYAMASCVAQLRALLDRLGVDRVDLVGYSMGGRAALSFAVAAPQRVRSLALIGATAGLESESERMARAAADEILAARIREEGVAPFVDAWMALPLFASQVRLGEAALAEARAQRLRCRASGLAGSLRGMGTGAMPPLHASLPTLDLPVLLIVGEEDAKFRAIAADLADRLPDARLAVVPEAGHAAHLENPAVFAARLSDFWASLPSPRTADSGYDGRSPTGRINP